MSDQNPAKSRVVLVTGPAGAGRTTAIRALEDLGYEAIDNLPLRLLPELLSDHAAEARLALGVDTRTRDFSSSILTRFMAQLREQSGAPATLLYIDCRADVLLRRFSETRRRHPLAPSETPGDGIERDFELLAPIRARADVLIDTSDLNVHQLRDEIDRWFKPDRAAALAISIQSFSYKRGLPHGIDMVFDCRFLRNPHWRDDLRSLDGRDPSVASYVREDPHFAPFFDKVESLILSLLPAFIAEGKSHLAIGFGCTGGQHRSVMVTEALSMILAEQGWQVSIRHREMERRKSG